MEWRCRGADVQILIFEKAERFRDSKYSRHQHERYSTKPAIKIQWWVRPTLTDRCLLTLHVIFESVPQTRALPLMSLLVTNQPFLALYLRWARSPFLHCATLSLSTTKSLPIADSGKAAQNQSSGAGFNDSTIATASRHSSVMLSQTIVITF